KASVAMLFEPQQPVAEDVTRGERLAHSGRDGAQVLADNDESAAMALESEYSKQILNVIPHVHSLFCCQLVREPEETAEGHDVIEREGSAVACCVTDGAGEELVAVG